MQYVSFGFSEQEYQEKRYIRKLILVKVMSIEAQKLRLIERITHIENQAVLDQIHAVLERGEKDFYGELTEDQRAAIQRGLSQLESGNTVSEAEVKEIYKKWL